MSKSLKRVRAALDAAGVEVELRAMTEETRTAQQAAAAAGCELDQIAKSILFRGTQRGDTLLFVTAGGNQVCAESASALAGEPLERADAAFVRRQTGFAIGGVSPIGHLTPPRAYFDPRLLEFDVVWAAAGTPRHIFAIAPQELARLSGARTGDFTRSAEM